MLPGQLLEERFDVRRFGGIEGLYLAGSGAHPGGGVTGAPGYLAARAVIADLAGRSAGRISRPAERFDRSGSGVRPPRR
jgi:phytoene dehydrogenase-like protein